MINSKRNDSNYGLKHKSRSILAVCLMLFIAPSSLVAQTENGSAEEFGGKTGLSAVERKEGFQSRAPALELQSTIVGNQEQPEVIYILPWKQIDAPAPSYQPMQSMLDGQFEPLDRDEWRRNIDLRQAIDSDLQSSEQPQ